MNKEEHLLDDVAHEELGRHLAKMRLRVAIWCSGVQLFIVALFLMDRLGHGLMGRYSGVILLVMPAVNLIFRHRYRAPTP